MAVTIQVRRDTAANWVSASPVLHQGEIGFETDTGRHKIGDGSTAWTSLGYAAQQLTPTTQTTTYTASPGDYVKANISSASWTMKLPQAPPANTIVGAKVIAQATGNANTLTVACQGSDVFEQSGGGTSATMSLLNQAAAWQYNGGYWTRVSDDLPLGQLDGRYTHVYSPMAFGAAGNGTTDDTTAVKAAFAAAAAAPGGTVDLTGHKFLTSSPVTLPSNLKIVAGVGDTTVVGGLVNNTTDLFTVGAVSSVAFDGGYYQASAGHVFNASTGSCSLWTWRNVTLAQTGTGYSIWYMTNGLYLDMTVGEGCYLVANSGATVVPWYVVSGRGGANCNTWRDHRISLQSASGATVPFYHIESSSSSSYAASNLFSRITAEQCSGGIITALSVTQLTIDNVVGYDVTTYGADVFTVGAGGGGLHSLIISARNSGWAGGALGSGVHDFNSGSTTAVVLENVGPQSTGYAPVYDISSAATTIGRGGSVAKSLPAPSDLGLLGWTCYPGTYASTTKPAAGYAGYLLLWAVWIPQACTVSNITYGIDVAGGTMSNAYLGLYAWGSSSNALLASCTTDQSTNMTAGANSYTAALSSSYTVPHAGMYFIGLVIGSATTMPTFISGSPAQSSVFQNLGMSSYQYVTAYVNTSGLTALPNPSGTVAVVNAGLPVFVLT